MLFELLNMPCRSSSRLTRWLQTLTFSLTVVSGQELFLISQRLTPMALWFCCSRVPGAALLSSPPWSTTMVHACKPQPMIQTLWGLATSVTQYRSYSRSSWMVSNSCQASFAATGGGRWCRTRELPHFATVETLATLAKESLAFIRFSVSCTSTAPGMGASAIDRPFGHTLVGSPHRVQRPGILPRAAWWR